MSGRAAKTWPVLVTSAALPGAYAGVAGGQAYGVAMLELRQLESIASLMGADSNVVGFGIHLFVSAVIGIGFGLFVWVQRPSVGETVYWGLVYGAAWWFLGAVTLLPLLSGDPLAWDVVAARQMLPALIGHLVYGLVTALAYLVVRREDFVIRFDRGSLVRGAVAGAFGAALLGAVLHDRAGLPAVSASMVDRSGLVAWTVTILLGVAAGLGYGVLHPDADGGIGPSLIRGLASGFGWWVVAALTAIPVLAGDGLRWAVDDVRAGFATFPGYLLFLGAIPAVVHHGLTLGWRALVSDVSMRADEGIGTQGLRATGRGVAAGLAGGLVFTVVMVQIGYLSTVAGLVGQNSTVVGLIIHLFVATTIGVAYGFLFIGCSNDAGSALGWGVAYGVLWWLVGPLTLLPMFLGDAPQWTVQAATDAYPALIGHLAYGALLGVTFFRLEARHNPWWISRTDAEAERAARSSEQLLSSAPGLWALTALIALAVPVLLGGAPG